ncbi:carbohydrate binding family 9 domain-containing protein [bacterium]|nr:carbohydrate binding family 9 domain-containing protein [bacterium]
MMQNTRYSLLPALSVFLLLRGAALTGMIIDGVTVTPLPLQTAPVIDGSIDPAEWGAPLIDAPFITYNPTRGETLPQKTHVWIAYDRDCIYIAFRCYDTEPEKIKTSVTSRDNMFSDDWVGLSLDALGNSQSSYDLFVNPNGIQGDILTSAVSGEDVSPDFVWESAGRVHGDGYDVELRLPLRSIRFKSGETVEMGILFWRRISRLGTSGSWPEIPAGQGIFNTHARALFHNLEPPILLEILPSITCGGQADRISKAAWSRYNTRGDFGIGLKYGLTSAVTAEATYNPDFSQVESDAFQAETNRRYPVFYSEKRPFFMEGTDIFDFSIIGHGNMLTAVHTRQIVDPLWAGKLTGTSGKTSFGVLSAGDEFPGYAWNDGQNPDEGKRSLYMIARGKFSLGGDNYIGALYSGREFAGTGNHVTGGDAQIRFGRNHQTAFSLLHSSTNTGGRTLQGTGLNAAYSYQTRTFGTAVSYEHYDPHFAMASAFMQRSGIDGGWAYIGYNLFPDPEKTYWLRSISPELVYSRTFDLVTRKQDSYAYAGINFSFTRQGSLHLETDYTEEFWQGRMYRKNSALMSGSVQLNKWLRVEASTARGGRIFYYGNPSYAGYIYNGSFGFTLQPGEKFSQSVFGYSETFYRSADDAYIYNLNIINTRTTYQFNRYFFVRAILQYNSYDRRLLTDFLASFTFIPGTVVHLGYGSLYEQRTWDDHAWMPGSGRLIEMHRGVFFKASYLWQAK